MHPTPAESQQRRIRSAFPCFRPTSPSSLLSARVEAAVDDMDADKAELQQLAEIDENLIRANLMPAEERRTSERRKQLYGGSTSSGKTRSSWTPRERDRKMRPLPNRLSS